ncbi:Carboxymuconolactone decarboxylase [Mycena chlorophos]|uniref:Carboxymuconolactone decarboxylase n=1 Tax=Mycena chlorophos TaxID=658473 RepID=A0A8H6WM65_MYCCL|nr:Carboxymuconolactone decarboxylase [Mycena chlorophos]
MSSLSRYVPGRFPEPGTSPIADRIRERRGARGLTPLDGTLLHVPAVAEGWNTLLGAVRTKGALPGDVRELMILRVAARNHAAFEWIHHEHVGRDHGLTTAHLWAIRDTRNPLQPSVLSPLYAAALAFADHSTVSVKVPQEVMVELREQLKPLASRVNLPVEDLLVEAAAVVASYNMVSRFLVSLDIAGSADNHVPWPVDAREYNISLDPDTTLHATTLETHPDAPWIVFSNSLLTNASMWDWVIPSIIAPSGESTWPFKGTYNILLHDQRGHGKSSTPLTNCTMTILAHDIAHLISSLIPSGKAKCVIGVSQGGAAVLAFGALYPTLTSGIISCDTGPATPPANVQAWKDRIALAKTEGIDKLAVVTVDRWFPVPSRCGQGGSRPGRAAAVAKMIETTTIPGFELGAGALMAYDLVKPLSENGVDLLHTATDIKVLLVAGSLDGAGAVAKGMKGLKENWVEATPAAKVDFAEIPGAGHLPMIDETEGFWDVVGPFLRTL